MTQPRQESFKMVAKTLFGFEDLLAKELRDLGATQISPGVRMVQFYGDTGFMYKANLCLRTALKILKPIATKKIRSQEELYQFIYDIPWLTYLDANDSFAVDATVNSTVFRHSKYAALKTKDAVVDRIRKETENRPNVNIEDPDLSLHLHIHQNVCTISLDSSGASLHQRGYRIQTNAAPINEVLAAGLLLHSGWSGQTDFMDPMCGSGTLAIEAAMIACNIPANLHRKEFAFEKWLDWDLELFERIEKAALAKSKDFSHKIWARDRDPHSIQAARENIQKAGLEEFITLEDQDFFSSTKPTENPLHLVCNPPYGERLEVDLFPFYSKIGDALKKNYPDTQAWIITTSLEALKHVGLRPSRKIKVFNGKLEGRLLNYQMYAGSKKAKYQ